MIMVDYPSSSIIWFSRWMKVEQIWYVCEMRVCVTCDISINSERKTFLFGNLTGSTRFWLWIIYEIFSWKLSLLDIFGGEFCGFQLIAGFFFYLEVSVFYFYFGIISFWNLFQFCTLFFFCFYTLKWRKLVFSIRICFY